LYGVNDKFHPLPTEEVKNYLRTHFQIDYPYLLYVGNLTQRKNLATYLRAFALIADEFPEYQLVIVGPSTFRASNLEPLIHELSLEKRIILTGHVAEEALPYLYNGADVFGFPSLYEGFGLPPLEAMACGTPVVVSNVSSLPEVVGEAALAIAPTDAEGFAEALQRLLKDEHLRQTLIEKGLAHAKQFTWKIATEKILAIYQKVL
ncbi:MAG: glycosyltransferase family 1 protein, partial [Phototrophicales bacterium]